MVVGSEAERRVGSDVREFKPHWGQFFFLFQFLN